MATEEQLTYNTNLAVGWVDSRVGQRLTIAGRTVSKLSFRLWKNGSPSYNLTFTIRKVSDDSLIVSKLWGDCSTLGASPGGLKEVTLDYPVYINEEVYLLCEGTGGDQDNSARVSIQTSDVKASEYTLRYVDLDSAYTEHATWDTVYVYTYEGGDVAPVVYPTDPITRVTGLTHYYSPGVFLLEEFFGDTSTDWAGMDASKEPTPTISPKRVAALKEMSDLLEDVKAKGYDYSKGIPQEYFTDLYGEAWAETEGKERVVSMQEHWLATQPDKPLPSAIAKGTENMESLNTQLGGSYVKGVLTPPSWWKGNTTDWVKYLRTKATNG